MSKKGNNEDSGSKVPGYIVTFSDMVTLLLTFFVLLLSLAVIQDPEMMNRTRNAFRMSIKLFGLGPLYGRMGKPEFGFKKKKYKIIKPGESYQGRTIDMKEEMIRRKFNKVNRNMTTMPSQIKARNIDFLPTNVHFSGNSLILDAPEKQELKQIYLNIQQNVRGENPNLYVLGLAGKEDSETGMSEKQKWIISARRAEKMASFLRTQSTSELQNIYWWGVGSGGEWVGSRSPFSSKTQIFLAILRPDS